jgi:hypothetical protein
MQSGMDARRAQETANARGFQYQQLGSNAIVSLESPRRIVALLVFCNGRLGQVNQLYPGSLNYFFNVLDAVSARYGAILSATTSREVNSVLSTRELHLAFASERSDRVTVMLGSSTGASADADVEPISVVERHVDETICASHGRGS